MIRTLARTPSARSSPGASLSPVLIAALAALALAPTLAVAQAGETGVGAALAPQERKTLETGATGSPPEGEGAAGQKRIVFEPPAGGKADEDRLLVVTEKGYLDYDEDANLIYANKRTRVYYKGLILEADTLSLDVPREEVTAVGNVELTGKGSDIQAERLRYSFRDEEGVAFQARGHYGPLFFRYNPKETAADPSFERLGADESLFRRATVTGCDFSVPHYRIRAREILLYQKDRLFLKGATFYLHKMPLLYLPVYSKSLREGSPWFVRLGYKSKVGAWARVGYVYHHTTQEPSLTDDDVMVTKSRGHLTLFADYLTKKGFGGGLTYKYSLDYDRHHGEIELYGLTDSDREVDHETEYTVYDRSRTATDAVVVVPGTVRAKRYDDDDEMGRYQALVKHKSQVADNVDWLLNVDWLSDPELYDEVLDLFRDVERKRVIERRARTALTWAREQFVARVLFEVKDRIGRDRVTNFSHLDDYARDLDEQPELIISEREDEGISARRWGRAAVRAPQVTLETAWLRLWNLPLYYHTDLNLFNNLDKGLNTVDQDDDAYVRGADWYNALMWRWRLSQRFTLLTKLGAGAGVAMRETNDYEYYDDRLFDDLAAMGLHNHIPHNSEGGLEFIDPHTFLIGDEEFNRERDVSDGFVYGDALVRLNARLTDALTGELTYRYRATTEHHLGDWYAEMGNRFARSDLYNFRLREHNIEAILRYILARPRLTLGLRAFHNFIGGGEAYPLELLSQYGVWAEWMNAAQTLSVSSGVDLSDRQIYHPSDPLAFIDSSMGWRTSVGYKSPSQLWWTQWTASFREELDQDIGDPHRDRFTENDNRFEVTGVLGGRVGPKWGAQVEGEWDSRASSLRELRLAFERDLHDALLLFSVGFEQDIYDDHDEEDNTKDENSFMDELDVRVALQPKLPQGQAPRGIPGVTTLQERAKTMVIEPGF